MRRPSRSLDPAVRKLLEASAASPEEGSHDPALLKALAEASTWIVALHGPKRSSAVERGLQRWLAESLLHRQAFEHATDTWNKTRATVRRSAHVEVSASQSAPALRWRWVPVLSAVAAALALATVGVLWQLNHAGTTTRVGERRTMILDDGTQVTLNTSTRIAVDYDGQYRRVRLTTGEALFEVAKQPDRPFIVTAGSKEVVALGTAFLVRRDPASTAVTLVEGKVTVRAAASTSEEAITLVPGERVVFAGTRPPRLDRPELEKLTAWQNGLINIDDLTLAAAAAEMNRYSTLQLIVEGAAAGLRVSGVFRVTDAQSMAQAVALTHGLQMHRQGDRIVLSGEPQKPSTARFGSEIQAAGSAAKKVD